MIYRLDAIAKTLIPYRNDKQFNRLLKAEEMLGGERLLEVCVSVTRLHKCR